MSTIPVIDIAPLADGSHHQAHAVATALGHACRDVGFFYVTGHGISPALIARVFDASATFFTGPAWIRVPVVNLIRLTAGAESRNASVL